MIQHQVTGIGDQSFSGIARIYGVGWKDVGIANFGRWGASYVYPWLRDHGGTPGADANVPTGQHWFWTVGMIVNVPTDRPSRSPYGSVFPVGVPGGPRVSLAEMGGLTGAPLEPQERAPDHAAYMANEEEAIAQADKQSGLADPSDPDPPATTRASAAQAGVGTGWMWFLILGVGVYVLMQKAGKPAPRKKKRKKARKARKIVRYY